MTLTVANISHRKAFKILQSSYCKVHAIETDETTDLEIIHRSTARFVVNYRYMINISCYVTSMLQELDWDSF